ncbi:transglutaminase [Oscillatoria sp. FACHB-1407]|uniref:transglutaminase domain-containing protein n=1 Tax=Oscillatoria sp. FACHB-1407 TaxID=2692847 RepID=UPI001683EBED|nr:transglutaminase domain-containing protein [Oscillatoria sp. FACHB-1407]MBD2463918.1 transglutaminase [Oscillatoria sp. FACHB-1407]
MRFLLLDLPILLLKGLLTLLVFLTPVLGVWLASSLVAYTNGTTWLVVFSGILLFPLLPIAWDLWGRKRRNLKPQILTWGDRIILRTLLLNLIFLICLLALRPQTSFLALSTRGDWMLDGRQEPRIELVRRSLFKLANGLEWLYLAVHQNPYTQYADTRDIRPTLQPEVQPSPQPTQSSQTSPQPQPTSQPAPSPSTTDRTNLWSVDASIHPAVAQMPPSVETSIASVAQYIAQQEKDPFLRVKALHDYVADRIAYDAPAYFGQAPRPPQDAETVFRTRKAVCAGYAKLLEALGQAIGEEIVYVVGDSRSQISDLNGSGHAWNAAKIEGNWYLIDATWNSGYVDASGFTKRYSASYLFPPPEVMIISHFPDDPAWQLLPQPLSRGDFLRQPMLRPNFFAQGLKLISPTRSQTDVRDDAVIQLQNPNQRWLMAIYGVKGSGQAEKCSEQISQDPQLSCSLPGTGTYEVRLFSGNQQYGQYEYVGQLEFNKG